MQKLRGKYSCILAGIGTVLADDPLLTCRLPGSRNPVRIICDSRGRIPEESQIVKTAGEVPTILACVEIEKEKKERLIKKGLEVLELPGEKEVNLKKLMEILGGRKLDSVLIEGGGEINYAALSAGLVNHIYAFVAPKVFGGAGKSPVAGSGVESPEEAFSFRLERSEIIGDDILLEYEKIR